ncbi:hypothetical protein [Phormidium sp. CCY1219]|jgi:hypothetical protein|uniref:hypothetical protein n=1 Tax=Phormidium sp. CCY1219 TaxID=2886104 RepID=UPI002D1EC1E9|nr:hypothetical protein [Phormidium sp. CCY1219]MEB3828222.1 hypothetical protein [Phormidium sp. CCY1219]
MTPEPNFHRAKPHQLSYRNWTILVFPTADGYRPLCLASETQVLSDGTPSPTPEAAIAVGKRCIDRAIATQNVA